MSDQNKNIIHYSAADIQKYLKGELSAPEMHAMEKAALDDPFLSDAMDGMRNHLQQKSSDDFDNDVAELKKRLAEKIKEEKKIIPLSRNIIWQRIAAVAVILIGSTFLIYNFVIKNSLAKNETNTIAKEKAVADSIITPNATAASAKKDSVVISSDVAINEKPKAIKSLKKEKEAAQQDLEKGFLNDSVDVKKDIKAEAENSETDKTPLHSVAKNEEKPKDKTGSVAQLDTLKQNPNNASPKIVESTLQGKAAGLVSVSKRKNNRTDLHNNSLEGRVLDENKNPIPGAIVMIKGKKVSANTDQHGNFKLNNVSNNDSVNVVINSVGFQQANATLNNAASNEIQLKQATQSLSEVVVVGYGSSKKKEIVDTTYNDDDDDSTTDINDEEDITFNALPIIGWHDYNNYINKNKKILTSDSTIKGREIISFIVDKNDKVSSFKIKKSLSKSHDAEAIRLIQQGPMWKLLRGKKEKITLAIVF